MSITKDIEFSYEKEEVQKKECIFLIITYTEDKKEKKLKLNMEEKSMNDLNDINNFILTSIMNGIEINFCFNKPKGLDDDSVICKVINSIIEVYKKEYKEIIEENIRNGFICS